MEVSTRTQVEVAFKAVTVAYDAVTLRESCFADLAELFRVIWKSTAEHTPEHRLAGIGLYLADEWAVDGEIHREELEIHLTALRERLAKEQAAA